MRAGLLSQPQVIQRLNQQFVSATLPHSELVALADSGDKLAREVLGQWRIPLALVLLSPEGQHITKLNSLADLTEVHPDTTKRPEAPQYHSLNSDTNNARIFLKRLDQHFPIRRPDPRGGD